MPVVRRGLATDTSTMDQGNPSQPDPPAQRDRKRQRLSDPGPFLVGPYPSPPTLPPVPPAPPPRRPWPTRIQKEDIVSLEQRLRYLDRMLDEAEEVSLPRARRAVEELRSGGGSLSRIHITDSLRTSLTQEEYGQARDEEIKREIHRDGHRKIASGGVRRFTEPPRLSTIPELRSERDRKLSLVIGHTRAADRAAKNNLATFQAAKEKFAREKTVKEEAAKYQAREDKSENHRAAKDPYAARKQALNKEGLEEYSERRMEEAKAKKEPEETVQLTWREMRSLSPAEVPREKWMKEEGIPK
ncbi:hypothetical protein TWF281_009354 [Arthrobotrys megalospora]